MKISLDLLMSELEESIELISDLRKSDWNNPDFITWKKDIGILMGLISETGKVRILRFWTIKFYPKDRNSEREEKLASFIDGLNQSEHFLKNIFLELKKENPDYRKIIKKTEIEESTIEFFIRHWKLSAILIFIFYFFIAYIIPQINL